MKSQLRVSALRLRAMGFYTEPVLVLLYRALVVLSTLIKNVTYQVSSFVTEQLHLILKFNKVKQQNGCLPSQRSFGIFRCMPKSTTQEIR